MRPLKLTAIIIIFCALTILTQIGGVVYLLSRLAYQFIGKWTTSTFLAVFYKFTCFVVFYAVATFLIVPIIAKPLGRVPLPLTTTNHLKPLTVLTCLLNRNYVTPELRQVAFEVAKQMNDSFPGTTVNYLDANFPFVKKFPLIPHLSHNDGKKPDLSFCYLSSITGKSTNACPSFIGYGICEDPLPNEQSTANFCAEKGYWQYGFLTKVVPQKNKKVFKLDNDRTRVLVSLFASKSVIGKVFIEPHLKLRLKLTSEKIRFHGCQAVRHDDHIHVQLQ
jgi:hypothetical protein